MNTAFETPENIADLKDHPRLFVRNVFVAVVGESEETISAALKFFNGQLDVMGDPDRKDTYSPVERLKICLELVSATVSLLRTPSIYSRSVHDKLKALRQRSFSFLTSWELMPSLAGATKEQRVLTMRTLTGATLQLFADHDHQALKATETFILTAKSITQGGARMSYDVTGLTEGAIRAELKPAIWDVVAAWNRENMGGRNFYFEDLLYRLDFAHPDHMRKGPLPKEVSAFFDRTIPPQRTTWQAFKTLENDLINGSFGKGHKQANPGQPQAPIKPGLTGKITQPS